MIVVRMNAKVVILERNSENSSFIRIFHPCFVNQSVLTELTCIRLWTRAKGIE